MADDLFDDLVGDICGRQHGDMKRMLKDNKAAAEYVKNGTE